MAIKNTISVPSHIVSQKILLNHNKNIGEKSAKKDDLSALIREKALEKPNKFCRDLYGVEDHDVNDNTEKCKCIASPTMFADDAEANIISPFSCGISLDYLTLAMIKWPGLDDSNNVMLESNYDDKKIIDGNLNTYQTGYYYGNWLPTNNSKNILPNEVLSSCYYAPLPSSHQTFNGIHKKNDGIDLKKNQHVIPNTDLDDSALFNDDSVNECIKKWPLNKIQLVNELNAPVVAKNSQENDIEIKISSIIESSFDLLKNGDSIVGSFAPLLSQNDMHKCLLRVIESLLETSEELNMVLVYQKVFEKFTLDISKLDVPSVGSFLHDDGYCKPCVFANKKTKTCENGIMCYFCHHVHKDVRHRVKNRRRKYQSKKSSNKNSASNSTDSNSSASNSTSPKNSSGQS